MHTLSNVWNISVKNWYPSGLSSTEQSWGTSNLAQQSISCHYFHSTMKLAKTYLGTKKASVNRKSSAYPNFLRTVQVVSSLPRWINIVWRYKNPSSVSPSSRTPPSSCWRTISFMPSSSWSWRGASKHFRWRLCQGREYVAKNSLLLGIHLTRKHRVFHPCSHRITWISAWAH